MSQHRPVLVLAGTARVVVAVARSLHRHGIEVDVARSPASGQEIITSRTIRQVHWLPSFLADPAAFRAALNELLAKYGYDTLIPTTDESLIAIAPFYDDLCQRLYPGCPRPEIVNSVLDKRLTLDAARACDINIPREYQFGSLGGLEEERDRLRFPLLAKPASKVEEVNFALHYYADYDQLRAAFLDDPSFGRKFLLQEYCRGYGVGVEMLIWDGAVHTVFQHRRLKELPSTGGVSILAEAETPDPELVELSTRLLRRLHWQGVAMVEFRYDPIDRRAALMEVNGRYWGSLPLSVNAGVEFPYYEWQLAHAQPHAGAVPSYAPGFRTLWRVGDLMRFTSLIARWRSGQESFRALAKEAWALAADFCSLTPDAIWQWRDPRPAVLEFHARILKRLIRPGIVKKVLPANLVREARIYRDYGLRLGLRHTYSGVLHAAGLRGRHLQSSWHHSRSVLFLCSGNIIRSPLAARLLAQHLKNAACMTVTSAGLLTGPDRPADPAANIAAREIGVSLDDHRSRPLTSDMVDQSDIIFVMDYLNEAVLLSRFPQAARKMFLLGACADARSKAVEIADPYGRGLGEVRQCYRQIENCIQTLCTWHGRGTD